MIYILGSRLQYETSRHQTRISFKIKLWLNKKNKKCHLMTYCDEDSRKQNVI